MTWRIIQWVGGIIALLVGVWQAKEGHFYWAAVYLYWALDLQGGSRWPND